MIDELRALAVFAQVARSRSIRGAARELGLSPSVVSHHVRTLEERVGGVLLHRTTRKLAFTPAGDRLAAEAAAMVACAERGLDEVRGASAALRGTLRVTLPGFLAATRLPADLAAFATAHPDVRLVLGFTETPRDLVGDGFDLALRFMGRQADSTHHTRVLAEMRRVLVAAPALVAARPPVRAPADLAAWPFVHLASRPPVLEVRRGRARPVEVGYTPRVVVDTAIAMRALVVAGAGATSLPEVLVRAELAAGRLVPVLGGWQVTSIPVHAVWPHTTVRASLTQRFLAHLGPRVAALFAPA